MEHFQGRLASLVSTPERATLAASRWPVVIASGAALGTCAFVVGLRIANAGAEPEGWNWWLVAWCATGLAYAWAGSVAVVDRTGRRLGVLLLIVGASSLISAASVQHAGYASAVGSSQWPWLADAAVWAGPLGVAVLVGLVPWELVARSWRTRRASRIARAAAVVGAGLLLVGDDTVADRAGRWVIAVAGAVGVGALGVRWWHRRQGDGDPLGGWLFVGTLVAWLALVPSSLDLAGMRIPGEASVAPILLLATVPLLVVGALVDLHRGTRPQVEHVSHRAIEWVLLATGVIVVYTGVVAGLGEVVGGDGPTWLLVAATGAIALALEPVRDRIRRFVDRLVYGSRDDALGVVQRIVDHVGADAGEDLLPALVSSLERELRLDAVAIDVAGPSGWERAAAVGPETVHRREVLLTDRTGVVGRLVVGWDRGPSMRARDEQLLTHLAGPLSLAVGWVRLAAELRRSSVAVVSAREEERRRLRRELHDGLGPALTGTSLGLRTVVRQMSRLDADPAVQSSRLLLDRLADEIDAAVEEVKQIARGLRPTALDQFGFVGAVAEFSRRLGDDLQVHLVLPPLPAALPAAVEAAAYRIVTEALTNVVRHARARECWLTIEAAETVEIDVRDDGIGLAHRSPDGVGLTAMRERASELGGEVLLSPRQPRGTHLHVRLPAALP